MTKLKIIFIVFTSILLNTINIECSKSQNSENKSGTLYSFYGIGMPLVHNSAQEKALGVPGISFNDLRTGGINNPAFWSFGSYTRISANFDFANYEVSDFSGSSTNSLFSFGSFQAVFPISKNKLGLSVSLYPETRISYNTNFDDSFNFGGTELQYSSNRTGTGGATKFEVGLGYKVFEWLSIGYAPSYTFLTEEEKRSISFLEDSFTENIQTIRTNGNAISHKIGALFVKENLFRGNDIIQIGITTGLQTDIDAKRKRETLLQINSVEEKVQIGEIINGKVSLPFKYGVGLTYFSGPKFNLSVEYLNENWGASEYGFSGEQESFLKDRQFFGFGAQFHPYKSRSDKFLSNFKYSAGISYDTGHLEIQNEEINTLWFSAGLGLISPNLRSASSFDLSLQYGIRGTNNQNLVKENIFSINLTVNLTELMFLQRKLN